MASTTYRLAFEQPIYRLEEQIAQLEATEPKSPELHDQIRALRRELADTTRRIYSQLDPWETVQVARHPDRPMLTDYLNLLFDEFVELHGDKFFGDDRALRTGFAKLDRYKVLVVGHYKGKTLKERNECFFGCAHPEGYRKAMVKMQLAAKYRLPIICLIDTPGAYPGIGAEERGQAQVIAESMLEMSRLPTPIICVVIGEGGSGGALGIGVGDRVAVLQFAYYSVISPEGCAGILVEEPRLRPGRGPGAQAHVEVSARARLRRRRDRRTARRRPPRPSSNGGPAQDVSRQNAPRAGRPADRQAAGRPLRKVPPHGPLPRRRRG